ncbi:MAG: ParA family protein [Planctomycetes bacterium]|nr:ParA family protein [Planctomycetota bacterium]
MNSFVLFNNKCGVGKTTLTFNLAHMFARRGARTVLVDYDPQCNLSVFALGEDLLVSLWEDEGDHAGETVANCIDLVRRGKGDLRPPVLQSVADNLWLLPGDLALSRFEQSLAEAWGQVHQTDNERAFHVATSLFRLARMAAETENADVLLLDVGPNLGAINRAALLAADAIIMPVAPDLFSLQGLRNTGPTIDQWRKDWQRLEERPGLSFPSVGRFKPRGYIVQQHLARADRPVTAYQLWADRIPQCFHEHVLQEGREKWPPSGEADPYRLAMVKHYASLVPLAQQARKPIFDLKQVDGVSGGQTQSVARARKEFEELVDAIRELFVA